MSTRSRDLSPPYKWTTRDGSLNGRPRRNRSLIKLKIAVLSPIPSARVITAIEVNAGDCRSLRNAKRISFMFEYGVDRFGEIHSARRARTGSTRVARRAGNKQATNAT